MSTTGLHFSLLLSLGLHLFVCCQAMRRICIGAEHTPFDDYYEICCNGEVTKRVRDQECCDNKTVYFTSESICCRGQILERFVPPKGSLLKKCSHNDEQCREQSCCGGVGVDTEETMCCQDRAYNLNQTQLIERDLLQCCGSQIINRFTHFCCGNKKYPRNAAFACCGQVYFDPGAEKCLTQFSPPRVVGKYRNICGLQEYDVRNSSCCGKTLHSVPENDPSNPLQKNPHFSCCNDLVYDESTEKCCRESYTGFQTHIIPNLPDIRCCGTAFYNASHEDCFRGQVLKKVVGKERCGFSYIDGQTEKCCAHQVYSASTHQCCMGTGDNFSIIPKSETCCNGVGISESMLCCEDVLPTLKQRPDDKKCCLNHKLGVAQTYNPKHKEQCVDGRVRTLRHGSKPCGLHGFYQPKIQMCCGGKVYDFKSGLDECCDGRPYNSLSQQCCNDVVDLSKEEGSCCEADFKVYRFEDDTNPCLRRCGNQTYDRTQQICCQGVVHDNTEQTKGCCGFAAFDRYKEGCCGGLFTWSKSGNTRCCADRDVYNVKHARCQQKQIIPRDPALQPLSDVQKLCSPAALKYFDGGIKYGCESKYIFTGRLFKVQMMEGITQNSTTVILTLVDVTPLERGPLFTSFKIPSKIIVRIEVPHHENIQCRKKDFTRFCRVLVFLNDTVKEGHVSVGKDSTFLISSYTLKREYLVTKKLSYGFCQKYFKMRQTQT